MDRTLGRLLWLMIGLIPAVVLISYSGGVWLSRRALKPVDEITSAAKNIGIEDLSQRLVVPQSGDELQRLSQTWNEMLARLEDAFARLSRFTADASHELRTPLAVIRSTAEIAGRRSRSEQAYRSALNAIANESERMTALIDDLLFLARCDANNLDLPMGPVALDDVLREAEVMLLPAAASRRVELRIAGGAGSPTVWGNGAAIRRLVLILGDNAIKYSREGGSVALSTELRGDQVYLRVQDQGIGIPHSELPFVFQRFYRGANAREGGNNGFGLGLALASGIAERHRSAVRVTSTPDQGSAFEVAFPRSPA
jgi:signal transduction histidine kinase